MTDILIMLGIIIASLFIIQKLPSRKSLLYVLLSIGIIPIFYFYSIKYYYVDHAGNTAGAYILVAAMCTVILFNELKQSLPKFVIGWNILQIISIVAASSYLLLYKSKVSILALIFFLFCVYQGYSKIQYYGIRGFIVFSHYFSYLDQLESGLSHKEIMMD